VSDRLVTHFYSTLKFDLQPKNFLTRINTKNYKLGARSLALDERLPDEKQPMTMVVQEATFDKGIRC
jgi:hypothetical protein